MKLIFRTVGWHAAGSKGDISYGIEGYEENGYNAIVWANKKSSKSEQLDRGPFNVRTGCRTLSGRRGRPGVAMEIHSVDPFTIVLH
jgi:hypothetical protein